MPRPAQHPARFIRAAGLTLLMLAGQNLPVMALQASAQTAASATVMVDVPLSGLQDWIAVRNALASLGDGVGARVEALSSQGAIVSFVWSGDSGTLDAALARVGYRLDRAATPTGRPVLRTAR